jgi:hypothetical protein
MGEAKRGDEGKKGVIMHPMIPSNIKAPAMFIGAAGLTSLLMNLRDAMQERFMKGNPRGDTWCCMCSKISYYVSRRRTYSSRE